MTQATYNADNTITEISDYDLPPDKPDRRFYGGQLEMYQRHLEAWGIVMEGYNAGKAQYEKTLRVIPCSPECRGLWAEGQKLEEGKDYEVREADWMPETEDEYNQALYESKHELTGPVPKVLTAFPLPVKSDEHLWIEVVHYLKNNPGLSDNTKISDLKQSFSLTKR